MTHIELKFCLPACCLAYHTNGESKFIAASGTWAEIYSLTSGIWTSEVPLPRKYLNGASVLYFNGFLMVGGAHSAFVTEFNPLNETFTLWTKKLRAPRTYHYALIFSNEDLKCN